MSKHFYLCQKLFLSMLKLCQNHFQFTSKLFQIHFNFTSIFIPKSFQLHSYIIPITFQRHSNDIPKHSKIAILAKMTSAGPFLNGNDNFGMSMECHWNAQNPKTPISLILI